MLATPDNCQPHSLLHEVNSSMSFRFTDIVPLVDPQPYLASTVPNSKLKVLNGELVATLPEYLFNIFVVGDNRVGAAPYCQEVYRLWKNSLMLQHQHPVLYSFPSLYSMKLPFSTDIEPTPEAITRYSEEPTCSYPFDIELHPILDSPVVIYKGLGIPSGLTLINGAIHIVSTPLKGITPEGELLFITNNGSSKPPITYPSAAIVGDEIEFDSQTNKKIFDLFLQAPIR